MNEHVEPSVRDNLLEIFKICEAPMTAHGLIDRLRGKFTEYSVASELLALVRSGAVSSVADVNHPGRAVYRLAEPGSKSLSVREAIIAALQLTPANRGDIARLVDRTPELVDYHLGKLKAEHVAHRTEAGLWKLGAGADRAEHAARAKPAPTSRTPAPVPAGNQAPNTPTATKQAASQAAPAQENTAPALAAASKLAAPKSLSVSQAKPKGRPAVPPQAEIEAAPAGIEVDLERVMRRLQPIGGIAAKLKLLEELQQVMPANIATHLREIHEHLAGAAA